MPRVVRPPIAKRGARPKFSRRLASRESFDEAQNDAIELGEAPQDILAQSTNGKVRVRLSRQTRESVEEVKSACAIGGVAVVAAIIITAALLIGAGLGAGFAPLVRESLQVEPTIIISPSTPPTPPLAPPPLQAPPPTSPPPLLPPLLRH